MNAPVRSPLPAAHCEQRESLPSAANLSERLRRDGHKTLARHYQPAKDILAKVGDKWSVLVLTLLGEGPMRFNEIRRLIGVISQRMLTLTLRGLERDGLVARTVFPTVPPRVNYQLTELGRSLREPVLALGEWAFANIPRVEAARREFDLRESAKNESAADKFLDTEAGSSVSAAIHHQEIVPTRPPSAKIVLPVV